MKQKLSLDAIQTLKNTEFRNLITGRFFVILAFKMTATLLGWWVYDLTNDPFSIGLIGLSEVIPAVGFSLYAGHFIDMNEKRRVLLGCTIAYIVFLGMLLIPAWFQDSIGASNHQVLYFIYFIVFLTGIARAFLAPIIPAMLPKIVGKELLPRAVTLNQTTYLSASVIGHALGGFLVGLVEIKGTLLIIVLSLIFSLTLYLKINRQYSEIQNKEVKIWSSIKEGLQYIIKTKEILGALSLDLFAVLFGGAVALIPAFARDILQVGATEYGMLNAASDFGSAITILGLTFFPLRRKQGKILIISMFGFGFFIVLFGLSKYFLLSFFALFISGILDGISIVIRGTILQLKTPDHLKGRVMSVNGMFVMSSNELGQFESGVAARLLGVANAVIFGGLMTMGISVLVGLTSPKLRKMEY